jgi:hypothetical protein
VVMDHLGARLAWCVLCFRCQPVLGPTVAAPAVPKDDSRARVALRPSACPCEGMASREAKLVVASSDHGSGLRTGLAHWRVSANGESNDGNVHRGQLHQVKPSLT